MPPCIFQDYMKSGVLHLAIGIGLLGQLQAFAAPDAAENAPIKMNGVPVSLLEKLSSEPVAKLTGVDVKGLPELDLGAVPRDLPNRTMLKELAGICLAVPEGIDLAKIWNAVDLSFARIKELNMEEGLKGRSCLVVLVPGAHKSAVIFFPPPGMRAGKFLIEFDPAMKKITNSIIFR